MGIKLVVEVAGGRGGGMLNIAVDTETLPVESKFAEAPQDDIDEGNRHTAPHSSDTAMGFSA